MNYQVKPPNLISISISAVCVQYLKRCIKTCSQTSFFLASDINQCFSQCRFTLLGRSKTHLEIKLVAFIMSFFSNQTQSFVLHP